MNGEQEPRTAVDARPFLPADANSPWTAAAERCDEMAQTAEEALEQCGVRALVLKSQLGEYPTTLSVTAWIPEDDAGATVAMRREWMTVTIEVNPYLEKPLIYHLRVRTKHREYASVEYDVDGGDAAALVLFMLGRGPRPKVLTSRIELLSRALLESIPFFPRQNQLVSEARPNRFTLPFVLVAGSAVILFFGLAAGMPSGIVWLLVAGALIAAFVIASRRPVSYNVVKRPEVAPRSLLLVDSWHTSIPGVGDCFDELVVRIERAVSRLDPTIHLSWETHHYRTPYGFEDRRRLTLTKDQAVVHIHLYPFADDAFVGWDGFLNRTCWAETVPVSVSIRDGKRTEFRSLTVAEYVPSEVDLVELNALSELVHRRMTMEIKAMLKERQIEADIDFSIIRGRRDGQLNEEGDRRSRSSRGGWRELRAAKT